MCSEEFKLAEEDLPFLRWANDFLASLYNQGGTKGGCKEIERVCVCVRLFVWLSLSLFLLLTHSVYKSLAAAKLKLSVVFVLLECIWDRCVY